MRKVLLAALASSPPAGAHGQAVLIRVIEAGTQREIPGALVSLLSVRDRVVARALTSEAGRAILDAPAPGSYRIRADRIGFRGLTTGPVSLAADERRRLTLEMPGEAILLPELSVEEGSPCRELGEAGPEVARLWEEAAKSLHARVLSAGAPLPGFRLITYRRRLSRSLALVTEQADTVPMPRVIRPFHALPTAELELKGFIEPAPAGDTYTFFGPDADLILSDWFLRGHCLAPRERTSGGERQHGLHFRPITRRSRPDITGTLWLDARTGLLRSIEFTYVSLPEGIVGEGLEGRIDLARHPSGAWYVERWFIRVPVARHSLAESAGLPGVRTTVVLGFTEDGGRAELLPSVH